MTGQDKQTTFEFSRYVRIEDAIGFTYAKLEAILPLSEDVLSDWAVCWPKNTLSYVWILEVRCWPRYSFEADVWIEVAKKATTDTQVISLPNTQ